MRILHTMIRSGNLDRSIKFYANVLNLKLLSFVKDPDGYPIELIGIK